jgi:Prokaryotic STING domain
MPVEQIVEAAARLGIEVVTKLFERKKDDKDLISVGLAVGYFYNFLDLISDVIKRDEVKLRENPNDGEGRHFDADTVELQVIVPGRLDVAAYDRCERDFKATKKSLIFLPQQNRWYGINYNLIERGDKPGLVIVDLARPLMSVKRFYEEILGYPTHEEANEKWIKAQRAEISAFEETLRRLQKRGYGALVNRLDFRERV